MADDSDPLKQYRALLEKQKGQLKNAKAYKGQKPSALMRRSRWELKQEFSLAASEMRGLWQGGRMVLSSFIGEAYPPCTRPLSSLVPIPIRDLALETQHRGRVLIVKTFAEPNRMTSIQNAVEDELGDVARLAIYNLLPTVAPDDILPLGAVVAVKEPYYKCTADGGLIVRVDHPSDFVALKPGSNIIPPRLAPDTIELGLSALSIKEDGNTAFKRNEWQLAIEHYSDALEADGLEGNGDLWRTLHRNRAGAHLRLGHYELAIADALAAIIPAEDDASEAAKDVNIKALYRAGRAAYEMGDFLQAKQHFKQALEVDTNHREARAELIRTEKRLAEQENGGYNFPAMAKSATKQHPRLDHASFLKNTEIASAGQRGRGLFATKDLKPGDVVFVEKAFQATHPKDSGDMSVLINVNTDRISMGTPSLRLYSIVDKLLWNPTLAKKYLDLFDGGKFGSSKGDAEVVDGKVAVDTFQVQSIADFNGFSCPRVKSSDKEEGGEKHNDYKTSTGIWLQASYANHSCLQNAAGAFIGDMMVVRALRDLRAGDEILMRYVGPIEPCAGRQKRMRNLYDFECDCALCQAEAKVPGPAVEKRARLRREIDAFLSANPLDDDTVWTVPAAKKAKGRRLLEGVRETYHPEELFRRLPRFDCVTIGLWVGVSALAGRPNDELGRFLSVLRDMGYFVAIQGGNATIDRGSAIIAPSAIHAAMYAGRVLAAMGNQGPASALGALARDLYIAMFGVDEGFEAEFGSAA
ncbi:hypothetical protein MKZ38_002599 [Zalerion maritima]|uniref:SET domain-containing protein n=1 Tax=Zalerion maritima TaxID=339359 RepID=A0AAD5RNP5_9PEZI|nr:hypothetical protein MKZ38_002599 [Zalerion maritima]